MFANIILLTFLALACSTYGYEWSSLVDNPIIAFTLYGNGTLEGYGSSPLSGGIAGSPNPFGKLGGFVAYSDTEPPLGYPGFHIQGLISRPVDGYPQSFSTGPSSVTSSLVSSYYFVRLHNSNELRNYMFYTFVGTPNKLWLRKSANWGKGSCGDYLSPEAWTSPSYSVLVYEAAAPFNISAVSATTLNDTHYIAIALSDYGVTNPAVLLSSYDMATFADLGYIKEPNANGVVVYQAFSLFAAVDVSSTSEEALYLYHIEKADGEAYLRYATIATAPYAEFDIVFTYDTGDIALKDQRGTRSAVSPNGEKVLLMRHGEEMTVFDGNKTMVQKIFNPTTWTASPEELVTVKDLDGTIRSVDALSVPAVISDRCATEILSGWSTALIWVDRNTSLVMSGLSSQF